MKDIVEKHYPIGTTLTYQPVSDLDKEKKFAKEHCFIMTGDFVLIWREGEENKAEIFKPKYKAFKGWNG
jgi:hypothetical protein